MISSRDYENGSRLMVVDELGPEDIAMLQALKSRSAESTLVHLDKVKEKGSSKFMQSYYVNYNHKSIADCGSTTMFIENVSLLAAKAIQDWPLYCGQETSTRYIDMSKQKIIDPIKSTTSQRIIARWMEFYESSQSAVVEHLREQHPRKADEKEDDWDRAVKARSFDILRGFLPAGICTLLSWHTNLRQAGDHLVGLRHHPLGEVQDLGKDLSALLAEAYPSSGLDASLPSVSGVKKTEGQEAREKYDALCGKWAYSANVCEIDVYGVQFGRGTDLPSFDRPPTDGPLDRPLTGSSYVENLKKYEDLLKTRPRGSILPHFLSDLGRFNFQFTLDFGSFRDLQRHRNGVCRMPVLKTNYGIEPWYMEQLPPALAEKAKLLVIDQFAEIDRLTDEENIYEAQYLLPLGARVATHITYGLPAMVYILELRSSKTVHPTLRNVVHRMIPMFERNFPYIALHVDMDPNDWDIRRGQQTIVEKSP